MQVTIFISLDFAREKKIVTGRKINNKQAVKWDRYRAGV
jgi:hypothetical protein